MDGEQVLRERVAAKGYRVESISYADDDYWPHYARVLTAVAGLGTCDSPVDRADLGTSEIYECVALRVLAWARRKACLRPLPLPIGEA